MAITSSLLSARQLIGTKPRSRYPSLPPLVGNALALIFAFLTAARRSYYAWRSPEWQHSAKVLIVGNISVGGSGKTPTTECIVSGLQQRGWRVGIVSRGYGAIKKHRQPTLVEPLMPAEKFGEEASWLARSTNAPVVVGADRRQAAEKLLQLHELDVIVSDDGLQHYALPRHLECLMLPDARLTQEPKLLPAGRLREPLARLRRADILVDNKLTGSDNADYFRDWPLARIHNLELASCTMQSLRDGEQLSIAAWRQQFGNSEIHLCCAIAQPQRLLDTLVQHLPKLNHSRHFFRDHHLFQQSDFASYHDKTIIMTEKDAIKCQDLDLGNAWFLRLRAQLSADFFTELEQLLQNTTETKKCQ